MYDDVEKYRELIMENIEYEYLLRERKLDPSELDEAVDLIVRGLHPTVRNRLKPLSSESSNKTK